MTANVNKLRRSASVSLSVLAVLLSTPVGGLPARAQVIPTAGQTPSPGDRIPRPRLSNGASSGSLLAMLPGGKSPGECPLKHTDVHAQVSGYVARVSVKQTFHNTFKNKIEAVYTFPLPENAAVDEMTMTIGSRVVKGEIKKKEEAREIYERAKARGNVASLLDQERPNIFTQAVANIEPGATVQIEIKYVDLLPYDSGNFTFTFPTVVAPRFIPGHSAGKSGIGRVADTDEVPDASKITPSIAAEGHRSGHDISIDVDIAAGVPISNVASKLHDVKIVPHGSEESHITLADRASIPNKDFVLSWSVAKDSLQSGYLTHRDTKSGYFTLMLLPPKRVTPENVAPKEMIFLIDCSGSQYGKPLDKAKETMDYIVDHMNANDTFQVLAFNSTLAEFAPKPQKASPEMREQAKHWINALQAVGGTWMAPAVEKVCSLPPDENRLRIVVFMTDGFVGNDFEIRGLVRKFRGTSRWFPFGTGNSVNRFLIDGIAQDGGGEAEYVLLNSPGPVVGEKFYKRISSPVLTDVKLEFNGLPVKEVYPVEVSDVWAEKPLYFKGRYLTPAAGTISLTGFSAGKPYKQDLKVVFPEKQEGNAVIKSIWARAKVDRLMSEDWMGAQRGAVNQELKDEIIKTALDYHLMTQYTSFVAVEEKADTKGGKPTTVPVDVDLPDGVSRERTLGEGSRKKRSTSSLNGLVPPLPVVSVGSSFPRGGFASAPSPAQIASGSGQASAYPSAPSYSGYSANAGSVYVGGGLSSRHRAAPTSMDFSGQSTVFAAGGGSSRGGGGGGGMLPPTNMGKFVHQHGDNMYTPNANISRQGEKFAESAYGVPKMPSVGAKNSLVPLSVGTSAGESASQGEDGGSFGDAGEETEKSKVEKTRTTGLSKNKDDLSKGDRTRDGRSDKSEAKTGASLESRSKLDALLLRLQSTANLGTKIDGLEIVDGKVSVKLQLSKVSDQILKTLKDAGFQLVSRKAESLSGRITVANLQKLCDMKEVLQIEPTKLGLE